MSTIKHYVGVLLWVILLVVIYFLQEAILEYLMDKLFAVLEYGCTTHEEISRRYIILLVVVPISIIIISKTLSFLNLDPEKKFIKEHGLTFNTGRNIPKVDLKKLGFSKILHDEYCWNLPLENVVTKKFGTDRITAGSVKVLNKEQTDWLKTQTNKSEKIKCKGADVPSYSLSLMQNIKGLEQSYSKVFYNSSELFNFIEHSENIPYSLRTAALKLEGKEISCEIANRNILIMSSNLKTIYEKYDLLVFTKEMSDFAAAVSTRQLA